jgi:hypothetical protein
MDCRRLDQYQYHYTVLTTRVCMGISVLGSSSQLGRSYARPSVRYGNHLISYRDGISLYFAGVYELVQTLRLSYWCPLGNSPTGF